MAKEQFRDKLGLSKANTIRLETINNILEEYALDNYILTLRQLYYQLVSRDVIPNSQKEYAKLSILLTKGRMAGIVDWKAIEDRGRLPRLPYYATDVPDALNDIYRQYRRNRQEGQPYYIEVWIEKDALSNIFSRTTEKYHIRLMVNKGYSSSSAMYEAAERFKEHGGEEGSVLIYFGDHDPSGKDMVRDITDRLTEMQVENLTVINPALTMAQIRQFRPPENPAKISDPRAKWYIEKYGNKSWELDALTPQTLTTIVEQSIMEYLDEDEYNRMLKIERIDKASIKEYIDNYEEPDYDNEEI